MSKKIVAILMAVAMAFSLLPVTAVAGNTSVQSITQPDAGTFATYEFYTAKDAESPWYTQTVKTGDTLNQPTDPTRLGYYFTGWKTENGQEVVFGKVTVAETSTIKCFAQWKANANPIHVYFMAAEGSNEVVYTGIAQNGAVTLPAEYNDVTWKTEDGTTFDGKNVTQDMNVYPASASCWLTFDSQGGSAVASRYVQQGQVFSLEVVEQPTKAGYTFAGWSLTAGGEGVMTVTPSGDTKLYATWNPATANYTVIHWQENANDDNYSYKESETMSGKTDSGTSATSKNYQGFTAEEITQGTIKGDGSTIINVYYARKEYSVKFYSNSGWYNPTKEYSNLRITAKYGANINDKWPIYNGSNSWATTDNGNTYQSNIDTMPLNGATFYGPKTGRGSESAYYYVEVLPGESGVEKNGVLYKLHHTDTSPGTGYTVTKEDKYPLTGFTYKEGTENRQSYNNSKFYYTRNNYNVIYMSNGSKVSENSYKYEQDISSAGNYTPTNTPVGYEFGGWCSDPSGTTSYEFSGKTMPAQNITVYAKWVPITLTLTIQDVEGVGSGEVSYNHPINEANVYTEATSKLTGANKTVLYWVNCDTGERVDVNSQMTTDLTIRPVLKGDTYTVRYNGGATTSDLQTYWYGTIAKVKEYQGDNSDKFRYWTDAAQKKYHPGDEIHMTANVTLTPCFNGSNPEQTKYSVTYHSNFETDETYVVEDIENYTQFVTKTYTETKLPIREGYDFTGWNTQADGKGTSFGAGSSARMDGPNNNDLYAQWSKSTSSSYTLTYDANGGQFDSEATTTSKEETIAATGDHDLNYTSDYTPTHAQSEDKNVIFLGWSAEKLDVLKSTSDAAEIAGKIITSVDVTDNGAIVYAVWSLDENDNNIPDVFEATIIYKIEHGKWTDDKGNITGTTGKEDITATFRLYEQQNDHSWKATDKLLRHGNFPVGHTGDVGYTGLGWYRNSETMESALVQPNTKVIDAVTGAETVFTYRYAPTPAKAYTVVLHLANGSYATTPATYTKNNDGTYQYSVTETSAVIKPENPSRNNFSFEGWSLSESAPQTLIGKDATFASLYLEQSGMTGSFDRIDLYAVWKEAEAPATTWDVSKSKTATNLDSNYESKVTLSLPSAEEKLESDIVFVMDGSSSAETEVVKESLSLLEELKQAAGENGAAVNVCIVKFKRQAFKSDWYDLSKDFDDIKTAMVAKYSGGTNLHAGLLAGKEALEKHTNVSASRKYLILVSDGSTYLYSKDGNWASDTPFTRSYYTKENFIVHLQNGQTAVYAGGFNDQGLYEPNSYNVNIPRPKDTSDVATWRAYLNDVEQRNKESNGDEYDYHLEYEKNFTQQQPSYDFTSQPCNQRTANNRDMAYYYADQTWQEMKEGGYHLFSIAVKDGSAGAGNSDDSHCFMNYLNDGKSLSFSEIQNEVIYAVSAGSTVTDTIGNEFTFGGVKSFVLTVGGKKIEGVVDASNTNTVNFATKKDNGTHPYTVTYTPDTKTFVWTINENVSNFAPVQLTYTVKLTNPKTAAGTYGQTDLDGDKLIDGTQTSVESSKALYTNESATLTPKDSQGNQGETLPFPKPSVSYTIKGGNNGGHGSNSKPSLNTKDHYGYIIGYPVDYYTGEPTTDQTKKPVRPEGKITRAEVATIYFRMLTDESRAKFWSQSNTYSDVKAGDWFNNAVSTLSNAGIIAGYEDGSFRPNGYITRAEFATIAARFFDATYSGKDLFPDIDGHWAKDYINQAANKGFVNGYEDGTFRPDRNITRAEAVTLVNRTLDRHPDKNYFTKDMLVWPDNMDTTKWYYADMQEATNSHQYQMLIKADKSQYEKWTKTLPIRNWEALEKEWSNANSSQGTGNVV